MRKLHKMTEDEKKLQLSFNYYILENRQFKFIGKVVL